MFWQIPEIAMKVRTLIAVDRARSKEELTRRRAPETRAMPRRGRATGRGRRPRRGSPRGGSRVANIRWRNRPERGRSVIAAISTRTSTHLCEHLQRGFAGTASAPAFRRRQRRRAETHARNSDPVVFSESMPKAASLRNLRPWTPGQSGNPNGRPRAPRFTERDQHAILTALRALHAMGQSRKIYGFTTE